MLKGYKFNQPYKKIVNKSVYAQEHNLLHDFLGTDKENIQLEYNNIREAINASAALRGYVKQERQPLLIFQRGCYVFAVRKPNKGDTECTN